MSTRTVTLSTEERQLLVEMVRAALSAVEDKRLMSPPDSPREAAYTADEEKLGALLIKFR